MAEVFLERNTVVLIQVVIGGLLQHLLFYLRLANGTSGTCYLEGTVKQNVPKGEYHFDLSNIMIIQSSFKSFPPRFCFAYDTIAKVALRQTHNTVTTNSQ